MPFYDYKCDDCDKVFEVQKGMNDATKPLCPSCGSRFNKRIFNTFRRLGTESERLSRYGTSGGACDTCVSGTCSSCGTKK